MHACKFEMSGIITDRCIHRISACICLGGSRRLCTYASSTVRADYKSVADPQNMVVVVVGGGGGGSPMEGSTFGS